MWVDASLGRNGAGSMGCLREVLGDVTLLHRGGSIYYVQRNLS